MVLSLGILLSAFANSEFQMVQFIPVIIIPQIFFAGIFPIENMTHWLQVVAKFMPMYYGGKALQNVMYKGFLFNDIKMDLLMLVLFAAVFIVLNIFTLKKYGSI
nr:ABC transporter permease [Clostridium sp. Marseille-Q2269]